MSLVLSVKKLIWRIMPNDTHRILRDIYFSLTLLPNYYYDYRRYLKYSGLNKSRQYQGEHAAKLTIDYHAIEKGLSLAKPRPGFGKEVVARLLGEVEHYIHNYGFIPPATIAIGVLNEYIDFNERQGVDVGAVKERLASILQNELSLEDFGQEGGTIEITRADLEARRNGGFKDFFNSRYSIRHFSEGVIPEDAIREAVTLALKTPSVCNRQTWKVHAYSNKSDIERLIAIQNGSRGFGEHASVVLVVACDLSLFVTEAERYQAWIDGGMFSMSLCLAFHSLGYGTCCLNWSKERQADIQLRQAFPLNNADQVIMMIAVGILPDSLRVAFSARRSLDEVLLMH